MVERVVWTADKSIRVELFADQTGQLSNPRGALLSDRLPLYKIGRRLIEMGYDSADLVPE